MCVIETWFYLAGPERASGDARASSPNRCDHPASIMLVAGEVVSLAQFARLLGARAQFLNGKLREPVLISSSGITVLYMVGDDPDHGRILPRPARPDARGILVLGLMGITYLVFENRYPQFYQLVALEERQQRTASR
jgi:hypothetical protein